METIGCLSLAWFELLDGLEMISCLGFGRCFTLVLCETEGEVWCAADTEGIASFCFWFRLCFALIVHWDGLYERDEAADTELYLGNGEGECSGQKEGRKNEKFGKRRHFWVR